MVLALALHVRNSYMPTNINHQNAPVVTINLVEALIPRKDIPDAVVIPENILSEPTSNQGIDALYAKMVNCGCVFVKSANKIGQLTMFLGVYKIFHVHILNLVSP